MSRRIAGLAIAGALAVCAGCGLSTYRGAAKDFSPETLEREQGWVVAGKVPLRRQQAIEDCGAAALSMVLTYLGHDTTIEQITREIPPRPKHGIKAGAMRDYARGKGYAAFVISGRVEDLERELARKRPVLVGMVKPHAHRVVTHYEVVVALHPRRREIVTLDPSAGWRRYPLDGFMREWEPTRRLALVVLPRAGSASVAR